MGRARLSAYNLSSPPPFLEGKDSKWNVCYRFSHQHQHHVSYGPLQTHGFLTLCFYRIHVMCDENVHHDQVRQIS